MMEVVFEFGVLAVIGILVWLYYKGILSPKVARILMVVATVLVGLLAVALLGYGLFVLFTGKIYMGILVILIDGLFLCLALMLLKFLLGLLEITNEQLVLKVSLASNLSGMIFFWGILIISLLDSKNFYVEVGLGQKIGLIVLLLIFALLFSFNGFNDWRNIKRNKTA